MVLMSAGKASRNQASIVNRPTCGGNKKAGIVSRQGFFMQSNVGLRRSPTISSINLHS